MTIKRLYNATSAAYISKKHYIAKTTVTERYITFLLPIVEVYFHQFSQNSSENMTIHNNA